MVLSSIIDILGYILRRWSNQCYHILVNIGSTNIKYVNINMESQNKHFDAVINIFMEFAKNLTHEILKISSGHNFALSSIVDDRTGRIMTWKHLVAFVFLDIPLIGQTYLADDKFCLSPWITFGMGLQSLMSSFSTSGKKCKFSTLNKIVKHDYTKNWFRIIDRFVHDKRTQHENNNIKIHIHHFQTIP